MVLAVARVVAGLGLEGVDDALRGEALGADPAGGIGEACTQCGDAQANGSQAQGIYAMNAPALTSLDATYLQRQLSYFKQGIRGSHKSDFYGAQMQLMAQSLHSEQDYAAIIAYISSLSDTAGSDAATLRSAP